MGEEDGTTTTTAAAAASTPAAPSFGEEEDDDDDGGEDEEEEEKQMGDTAESGVGGDEIDNDGGTGAMKETCMGLCTRNSSSSEEDKATKRVLGKLSSFRRGRRP